MDCAYKRKLHKSDMDKNSASPLHAVEPPYLAVQDMRTRKKKKKALHENGSSVRELGQGNVRRNTGTTLLKLKHSVRMTCYARNCYHHSGRNWMKKHNCKYLYDIRLVHCRYGGTDTGHAVRTLLQGILTNEAALQFSWKGSQGRKHAFVKLMAITNITSVRSTFPDASLASVAGVAKRRLVGAADRDGGRNERRRRDPASSPPNMN
ncbi:uncharacterized protein [Dermacentor andersoni]|uniref:uncharacterized protein isoform X1 n=1 Tax=Dermacentor andersoni TaxID=34620 RepID=UPI002417957F|nr:uncharacterized protein LOC129387820 isoform X2 [Dermacentor andersoni]